MQFRLLALGGAVLAASLLLVACGGDDDDAANTGAGNGGGNGGASAEPPADLTGQQVCDLVPSADVASALSVEVTATAPSGGGTPGCSYNYREGSAQTNFLLSVMRTSDVNGLTGSAAYDYAAEQNRRFAAGAPETPVSGVGDKALFMDGSATNILVVQSGQRVLTLVGGNLTADSAGSLAKIAIENLD